MFHIYVKSIPGDFRYMVIDDVARTYSYMNTLADKYKPNSFQYFAPSSSKFIEYLDKREHFFDEYVFFIAVPSLHDLPSLYPELFI